MQPTKPLDFDVTPRTITACQQLFINVMYKAKMTKAEIAEVMGYQSERYVIEILKGTQLIPGKKVKALSEVSGIAPDKFLKAWLSDKRHYYMAEIQRGEK